MRGYQDRVDAGQQLARAVQEIVQPVADLIVLGLPRGGVPVAAEVARVLTAPLDVLVVRKLGTPLNPELAFGAIGSGGAKYLDQRAIDYLGITEHEIEEIITREQAELSRREAAYRGKQELEVAGKTAIVVDDGIATGATLKAALLALRNLGPKEIIVAVPVAPSVAPEDFAGLCDEFVCPLLTNQLGSVGGWYRDFGQVKDSEVVQQLRRAGGTIL